jgi:hypothetical protein
LPARFEDIQVAVKAVQALWQKKLKSVLASRFWPRFGFKDVAYRVSKKVNPMIAWAKDE